MYAIFLRKFITKIIFNSKHFYYNIHFLNIVSVRWRPLLLTHPPQAFLEVLHHSLQRVEIVATSSLMFCFKSTVVLISFRTPCS
jgi:hypothetical protein